MGKGNQAINTCVVNNGNQERVMNMKRDVPEGPTVVSCGSTGIGGCQSGAQRCDRLPDTLKWRKGSFQTIMRKGFS